MADHLSNTPQEGASGDNDNDSYSNNKGTNNKRAVLKISGYVAFVCLLFHAESFLSTTWKQQFLERQTRGEVLNVSSSSSSIADVDAGSQSLHHMKATTTSSRSLLSEKITPESPLLVLSLPNSGNLALDRYFKCAGLTHKEHGRAFSHHPNSSTSPKPLSICLKQIVLSKGKNKGKSSSHTCGKDYRVWSELHHLSRTRARATAKRQCHFPLLQEPGFLDQLFQHFSSSHNNNNTTTTTTVLNAIYSEPSQWYERLSSKQLNRWSNYCNNPKYNEETDDVLMFPKHGSNATKSEWIRFYEQYQERLRNAVKRHSSTVHYMEIDLTALQKMAASQQQQQQQQTAATLEHALAIPSHCWTDAAMKPNLPWDVREPIFVTSLPKSATLTASKYLGCGLGPHQGVHKWTFHEQTRDNVEIGQCIKTNLEHNRSLLEHCGDFQHWSDFGVIRVTRKMENSACFYPSLNDNALQGMYNENPFGTLLHVIRPARDWYYSAKGWNAILNRWSHPICRGVFPIRLTSNTSDPQVWIDFYHRHTRRIQEFAKDHPSMAYVPVFLGNSSQEYYDDSSRFPSVEQTLQENFGFPSYCWGHERHQKKRPNGNNNNNNNTSTL